MSFYGRVNKWEPMCKTPKKVEQSAGVTAEKLRRQISMAANASWKLTLRDGELTRCSIEHRLWYLTKFKVHGIYKQEWFVINEYLEIIEENSGSKEMYAQLERSG